MQATSCKATLICEHSCRNVGNVFFCIVYGSQSEGRSVNVWVIRMNQSLLRLHYAWVSRCYRFDKSKNIPFVVVRNVLGLTPTSAASMKLCHWSSLNLNWLVLCFLWSCYSNFLLFVSILLVMHNSSTLHFCQSCCVCFSSGILTYKARKTYAFHTVVMDEIQHTLVRCPLRGQSSGNVGTKLERACRTCPGRGKYLSRPKFLPRFDH